MRAQLSFVLEGVLCQSLIPKAPARAACWRVEVMIPNAAIRNLIREDKIHQIYSQMQIGQAKFGMQTLNQCLAMLVQKRLISLERVCSARAIRTSSGRSSRDSSPCVPRLPPRRRPAPAAPARRVDGAKIPHTHAESTVLRTVTWDARLVRPPE